MLMQGSDATFLEMPDKASNREVIQHKFEVIQVFNGTFERPDVGETDARLTKFDFVGIAFEFQIV